MRSAAAAAYAVRAGALAPWVTTNISASDKVFGDRIIVGTYVQTPSLESPTTVITVNDNINVNGHITASGDISSSADVYGVTGSF